MKKSVIAIAIFCACALTTGCKSLADYSSKSNNPALYQQLLGNWHIEQAYSYDGYARQIAEIPLRSRFFFGEEGRFRDDRSILTEFYAQKHIERIHHLSWQIAEDSHAYVTLHSATGAKLSDLKMALLTRDDLTEKLHLDAKTNPALPDDGRVYFTLRDTNDCKVTEFPIRMAAGSHTCAYVMLVLSGKKA